MAFWNKNPEQVDFIVTNTHQPEIIENSEETKNSSKKFYLLAY